MLGRFEKKPKSLARSLAGALHLVRLSHAGCLQEAAESALYFPNSKIGNNKTSVGGDAWDGHDDGHECNG